MFYSYYNPIWLLNVKQDSDKCNIWNQNYHLKESQLITLLSRLVKKRGDFIQFFKFIYNFENNKRNFCFQSYFYHHM